jgi:hypothetical protein
LGADAPSALAAWPSDGDLGANVNAPAGSSDHSYK